VLTVHLLGPVEVRRDGESLDLGGPQPRAVIAHLALDAGRVVSVERLVDRLWGDDPPRTPLGTLQSYVSRLRRCLEPDRAAGTEAHVLVTEAPGYVLNIPAEQIDVHRFRRHVAEARQALADGDQEIALHGLDEALALWRGPALAAAGTPEHVRALIVQLDEERDWATESRFDALLALGRHTETVAALQAAVEASPLRERLWALLALALYRCSRQADALRALATARSTLVEELGLDPGPELRELEARILAHDPTLTLPAPPAAPAPTPPAPTVTPTAERPVPAEAELVGRSAEWSRLVDLLATAATGRPQLALLDGEPGIGKSTVSDALVRHASATGWHCAVGRCLEPDLAPSLWPWIEIVRDIAGDSEEASPTSAESPLRRLAGGDYDSSGSLTAIELAGQFISLLDETVPGPCLILFDDVHWADRATLDVLRLVLERLGSRPVMVVAAHRPPAFVPDSPLGDALGGLRRAVTTTSITVSPLDSTAVAHLMEITAGVAPSGELADRVRNRAGGNPLFVVELARLAGEHGVADNSVLPDAIRDVVRARLAQLPPQATAELEVAAVLGEHFELRTAIAVSERDAESCLDALDAAIVTRIVVPEASGFRFAHALVRDAVIVEVSPLRLARLHQRAAEAIAAMHGDTPDVAEPIAHHWLAAAQFADPVVVAQAAVRASDVARWRGALDAADRLAEQAIGGLGSVPRSARVDAIEVQALESMVSAAFRREDPRSDALAARIRELADRTGSDAVTALSLFFNWGDVDGTEDLATIVEPVERARALAARTTDPYAIVTSRYMVASYSLLVGRLDEAAEHVAVAINASGSSDPDAPPAHVPLVLLPVVAGVIEAVRGNGDLAREHAYRRARAWFARRSEVDPTASVELSFNRALVEAILGDPRAVLAELGDAASPVRAGFVRQELATCELLVGWARAKLGVTGGLAEAVEAMAEIDREGERSLRSCLRTFVADASLAVGDGRAVELLEQARSEALARGEVWWLSETVRLQAEADRRWGDGSRAAALLDEAETLAREHGAQLVLARLGTTRALDG
jgi:DNA-binding SARP family transcriptional activator